MKNSINSYQILSIFNQFDKINNQTNERYAQKQAIDKKSWISQRLRHIVKLTKQSVLRIGQFLNPYHFWTNLIWKI